MAIMNGVVEAVARSGKAIKIGADWYSAFTVAGLNGAAVGDNVEFVYTETTKEGTTYRNIKGSVKVKGSAPAPAAGGGEAPARTPAYSKGGRSFPVGPLDPERSIIRQNALTQANTLFRTLTGEKGASGLSTTAAAQGLIDIARIFESYSAGDMDAAEAAEAVEAMRSKMEA